MLLRGCTVLAALALVTPASAATPVGLRVFVQPWTPWGDDDNVYAVVDDSAFITNSLHDGWTANAPELHDALVSLLGTGDLVAPGVTMYGISLTLPEPTLTLTSLGGGAGAEPLDLVWTIAFDDVHIGADLTTPSDFGAYLDPAVTVDFDLTVSVPVGVGTDLATPFTTTASVDQQLIVLSDVRVDSDDFVADVALAIAKVFVDPDALLEDAGNAALADMNGDIVELLHETLADVNAEVSGAVPAGMVRLSAWADTSLTLAFGVIGPFPDGPSGYLAGTFESTSGEGLLTDVATCDAIPVSAFRKTGPRPIQNAWGDLGEEPLEVLPADFVCSASDEDGVATYGLVGLSAGFPNRISVGSDSGCDTSNPASIRHVCAVRGMPTRVLPPDFDKTYPLEGEVYTDLCGAQTPEVQTWYEEDVDPVINPADAVWSVFDDGSWIRFSTELSAPTVWTAPAASLTLPILEIQAYR